MAIRIETFLGSAIPAGALLADGSTHLTSEHPEIAAELGATEPEFTVPDLRGRVLIGAGGQFSPGDAGRLADAQSRPVLHIAGPVDPGAAGDVAVSMALVYVP